MQSITLNQTVSEKPVASDLPKPVWCRVPYVPAVYGISRTKTYQLAKAGKIGSVSLREPGQSKATRLFNVESIEAYIESFIPASIDNGEEVA